MSKVIYAIHLPTGQCQYTILPVDKPADKIVNPYFALVNTVDRIFDIDADLYVIWNSETCSWSIGSSRDTLTSYGHLPENVYQP